MQQNLLDILNLKGIKYSAFEFDSSVHTVAQAVHLTGSDDEQVIKNVVVKGRSGDYYIVTIRGKDKVDFKKLLEVIGDKIELATPNEVLENTGYAVGGVPSFGVEGVRFIIDAQVLKQSVIYTSGGDSTSLIAVSPFDMKDISRAWIVDCIQ
jgi:Cys-tRNA(Pro)/Cys-tRNA(Cys) deacylase